MTRYFITRHQGAVDWASTHGHPVDKTLSHLDPERINPGDIIYGTLPINLVAEINERGARYFHLSLQLTPDQRGRELSAEDLEHACARLEEYSASRVEP
ncbi:MAG: CRISPR-associated protein Csx16 [Thiotrichales bacterium]